MIEYLTTGASWSLSGLLISATLVLAYTLMVKPDGKRFVAASLSILLLYLLYGSPLAGLEAYGLHSVVMLRHIVLLMVLPPLLLVLPTRSNWDWVPAFNNNRTVILCWLLGAVAMWLGHYAGAAHLSAITARPVCGIIATAGSWWADFPPLFLTVLLLGSGLLFALPVFHGIQERRLSELPSVAFLFLSCVSCTLLGVWVTFSATSASAAPILALGLSGNAPLLPSPRLDQELAGLMMWVPGCILYATTSAGILLNWFDKPAITPTNLTKELSR